MAYWGLSSCSQIAITRGYFGYIGIYHLFFSQVDPELISIHHKKRSTSQATKAATRLWRCKGHPNRSFVALSSMGYLSQNLHGTGLRWAKNEDSSWKLAEIHTLLVILIKFWAEVLDHVRACWSLSIFGEYYIYILSRCVCVCVVSLFLSHHPLSNLRSSSSRFSSWGGNWSYDRLVGGFKPSWDHHPIPSHSICRVSLVSEVEVPGWTFRWFAFSTINIYVQA